MFNLFIQLLIEEILSGGKAYLASHPELGVPLGIFNTKNEPDYESRVKNIKKLGSKGSKHSLFYANYYGIDDPLPSFETEQEKITRLIRESNQYTERLRTSQERYNEDLMDTKLEWNSIAATIKNTGGVMVGFTKMISGMGQRMMQFTLDTRAQYDISEKIAEQYKTLSFNIGLTSHQGSLLGKTFKEAIPYITKYGGEAQDLQEIYSALIEESGRLQFLSSQDMKDLFILGTTLKMSNQDVASLADRFQLMGRNIESMKEEFKSVLKDSRALGLNAQKVAEVLETNFASMQRMSFAGGIKSMTQMAKLAVEMRLDVSEMLGMADKFYEPEAAIEAAAELQLMGGDIAAAFGDPFEIMYLARNKPEELARKVAEMTENMMIFNKETGEYTLPPEARQQLTFMADKLGLAKDNIIDTAFQASKLKDVKEAFGKGNMFDEKEQSALAQMAQFKDGEWRVTVGDEELALDDQALGKAVEDGLLKGKDKEEAPLEALKQSSFTTNQLLLNLLEEFKSGLAIKTDFYTMGENLVEATIPAMTEGMTKVLENITDEIAAAKTGTATNPLWTMFSPSTQTAFGDTLAAGVEKGFEAINATIKGDFVTASAALTSIVATWTTLINNWANMLNLGGGGGSGGQPIPNGPGGGGGGGNNIIWDFVSLPGGNRLMFDEQGTYNIAKNDLVIGGTNLLDTTAGGGGGDKQVITFGEPLRLEINVNGINSKVEEERIRKPLMNMIYSVFDSFEGDKWNGLKKTGNFADQNV